MERSAHLLKAVQKHQYIGPGSNAASKAANEVAVVETFAGCSLQSRLQPHLPVPVKFDKVR